MKELVHSARVFVEDMASTILFLIVLSVTHDVIVAVAAGMVLGSAQIGLLLARRKPIDMMQWVSLGLVLVAGSATLVTRDPRFVMMKPSVIYVIIGVVMLRRGWMTRYMPPIAVQGLPDLVIGFGYVWAGLMFASAALNLILAARLDPLTWASVIAIYGIVSKVTLFLVQYSLMRYIGVRRSQRRMALEAAAAG